MYHATMVSSLALTFRTQKYPLLLVNLHCSFFYFQEDVCIQFVTIYTSEIYSFKCLKDKYRIVT